MVFGTNLPIVAVISGSMHHDGSFDQWWSSQALCSHMKTCTQEEWYSEHNISKSEFKSFIFKNGFNRGDLILLSRANPRSVKIGSVLVYDAKGKPMPIIHRVVAIHNNTLEGGLYYETKGDHNPYQIHSVGLDEFHVNENAVRGKAFARIPFVGFIKIWFAELFSNIHN
jgi:signal peptidase I